MIVLDTCTIIWDALEPKKLSAAAKKAIQKANQEKGIYFCEIIFWEIAMLMQKKRLDPGTDYHTFIKLLLSANHYVMVGVTPEIAHLSVSLPAEINPDPVDRILMATASHKHVPLVTSDKNLRSTKWVETIW